MELRIEILDMGNDLCRIQIQTKEPRPRVIFQSRDFDLCDFVEYFGEIFDTPDVDALEKIGFGPNKPNLADVLKLAMLNTEKQA